MRCVMFYVFILVHAGARLETGILKGRVLVRQQWGDYVDNNYVSACFSRDHFAGPGIYQTRLLSGPAQDNDQRVGGYYLQLPQ